MSLELDVRVPERDVEAALTVADGETLAVLGPNGAGKSTLLAVMAGLVRPRHGRVVLDGRELTVAGVGRSVHVPPHDRRTALLGQEPLLFPHLSALDNVAFGARSAGAARRESRERAQGWLDRLGVGELSGRRPGQLSGGQSQRVAVARALAADPRVLLLDEPMAALDVDVAPAMRQLLRGVLADRTVVLVTHDVLDALLLADRVVVLEAGRVVEEGPATEVLSRPRSPFAARLAGLNLVEGTWTGEEVRSDWGSAVRGLASGPVPQPGDRVVATFRPHAVAVYRAPVTGSPRNSFAVTVTGLEPLGDLVRVRAVAGGQGGQGLAADVTVQSVAALELAAGQQVTFSVKATEVAVYPL
ncbi:ABC transporter ATP-binding protein [Nocardioides sp.]|uniref:sulfate/molybdate ABC transporter ATP-binding protein n=1 Tax=Nocardioides sp. TaxID=35761 RepID=UPI001A1BCA60|nr:ABC transporter ATP-binding protein [Nocardioides sp.]MBJ7356776.1 ABC transporter ATP-binding protein [Nocardioides sp.]